ncbi:MAG: hypothetical protein ABIP79_01445 [Chitinophagaceae bacterium]
MESSLLNDLFKFSAYTNLISSAKSFWERMVAARGAKSPEFLSSHSSDANSVAKIKAIMPQAMTFYKPVNKNSSTV